MTRRRDERPPPTKLKAVALAAAFFAAGMVPGVTDVLRAQVPEGGQQPQSEVVIDSIAVAGNVRLSRAEIITAANIRTGVPLNYRDVQEAIKDLWSTGQFRDIQVFASGGQEEGPVVLTYRVEEQDLVRTVEIRGLENVSESAVRDTANLRAGQPYSAERVTEAKEFIRRELADKGIPFARIDERREPVEGADKEIRLVLDVREGNRVTIADVEILGNEAFPDGPIVGAMGTRPEGFWWFQEGTYDRETYRQDLQTRIREFYTSEGYLDFEVVDDSLVVDPRTGKARLEITVREGDQYRVADFDIRGNEHFTTEELRELFQTEGGGLLASLGFGGAAEERGREPVFDAVAFQEATTRVQRLYNNDGYLYAQVQPSVEKVDAADGARVRVAWSIQEGDPAYIDRVSISGNDYTYERVIREKILILPGDVYSEDRLLQSYQNIQGLGFFETPMQPPSIEPDPQTGDVDITFNVTEKQTGTVNFGTAVGGGTGLSGFLGYDQPNLFGQAKEGHLRWDFGRFINSFTASYTDPALLGSQVRGSLSFFNSTDRFFQFQTGRRKRLGINTQFGIPVPWSRFTRFNVGYGISRTKYRLRQGAEDTSLFGRPPGTQSTLTLGLTRSTLNHPIFPTSGSRQQISFDLNGGLLGGDADFVKQTMEGRWWVPVAQLGGGGVAGGRGVRFALGLTLKAGAVYGEAQNFPFERFWMGGVQFGEQLRGYDETSITPRGYFPEGGGQISAIDRLGDAYFLMSGEYAMRLNDNVSISLFYDAGNTWRDPLSVDPSRLFRGAGVGLQLVTPFGPIGLDYAYGFDKDVPGWQLHFRMGPQF